MESAYFLIYYSLGMLLTVIYVINTRLPVISSIIVTYRDTYVLIYIIGLHYLGFHKLSINSQY